MAKLDPTPFVFPAYDTSLGWREASKAQYVRFKELSDASGAIDFNNPKASVVGAVLRWQRADGYACYIVTKDKPLTIAHLPVSDAWTIEPALIRGLTRDDVIEQLQRSAAYREIFGKR